MIVHSGTTIWRALCSDWLMLSYFLLVSLSAEAIYTFTPIKHTALPLVPLGILITAMSIFLAFQINQCYQRWWEARKLWGQLVNTSRRIGRQITTLVTLQRIAAISNDIEMRLLQKELVYRQIAYVNALRISLRAKGQLTEHEWQSISQWLPANDIGQLHPAKNITTQIIQQQAGRLARLISKDYAEQQILLVLEQSFGLLDDIQGGCERIKRTAFPDRFRFHTRVFVWLVATLIPFCMIQTDQTFDIYAIITETLLAFVFVTIEKLGSELRDPFEDNANDIPMTALCRVIEIDLRQQLGETDLPPALEPKKGILH